MKVLGLIDSFKGTLTSIELGEILKEELYKQNIECDYFPISDGGEGFLDSIEYIKGFKRMYLNASDPLGRIIETYYLFDEGTNTAYIELAKIAGIGLLSESELNPFITSTFGLGEVIRKSIEDGAKNIVLGIGGSCTNDGGAGMLEALGVDFYDDTNSRLSNLSNAILSEVKRIDITRFLEITKDIKFRVVSDVRNPLLGKNGATETFARQKGARTEELEELEYNLSNYSKAIERECGGLYSKLPGSGSAGGVGFAFLSMFKNIIFEDIDYILDLISFSKINDDYNYIITGEGKIDEQSLNGKVVFEILKRSAPSKVIILSAINELDITSIRVENVKFYWIVDGSVSVNESLENPEKYFRELIRKIEFN